MVFFLTFSEISVLSSTLLPSTASIISPSTQQAPTIAYSSAWTNNLPTINPNSNNLQVLCGHGVCDQSFDPGSRTHDNAVLSSAWTNNLPTINHEEMKSILD